MSDTPEKRIKATEVTEITLAYDNDPPTLVQVLIPVKAYAADEKRGRALMLGDLRELTEHVDLLITALRVREKQKGIIPASAGSIPPLTVR